MNAGGGQDEAVARLAAVRRESPSAIRERFTEQELAKVPKRFSPHIADMYGLPVIASGVKDGLAYVCLDNGRVFYGHMPAPSHRRQCRYVRDRLPPAIVEDAFLVARDVAVRYIQMQPLPPAAILPPRDGLVVECGAYLGHKSIAFADVLVPEGRVIAIEMIPENVSVLRRNVAENGLSDRILVLSHGVWNENGTLRVYSKGWQRNSLVDIGRLNGSVTDVPVRRIESAMRDLDLVGVPIDLIYVTVNGAEVQALQGLGSSWGDLRAAFIVSAYEVSGRSVNSLCQALLAEKGLTLVEEQQSRFISAFREPNGGIPSRQK